MTKRSGNFEKLNTKKTRYSNDSNDQWGDDLDCDAIDNCFKLATQLYQAVRAHT